MVWYQTNNQQVWAVVKTLAQIRHSRPIGAGWSRTQGPLARELLATPGVTA
jgi:hypothetical protein